MRKTLTALLFATALPTLAIAAPMDGGSPMDGGACPHMKEGHGGHGMMHGLNLSAEQRQKIGGAMHEQMQSQRDITKRYLDKLPEAERKAMQADIQASHEQHHQALRNLLSEEQRKAFDERQAEREARRAEWAEFLEWKKQKEAAAN